MGAGRPPAADDGRYNIVRLYPMSKPRETRPYDASGRRRGAEERRERVLEVARRLFAERGFAETTMEPIADEAGIALPTLYATFQSKRGVLDALLTRLVAGVPGGPPLVDTAGARAVLAEDDPQRLLTLFVADLGRVQESVIPIYEVMKHAARTEPEIAALVGRAQAYRLSNIATVAARLDELGVLRAGLTTDDAARTIWAIASAEVRQMLLGFAGWTVPQYQRWLRETLAAALLGPGGGVRSSGQ